MAQADSHNITAATAAPTRRRFLSQAAGVAAGSAVITLGTIPPRPAMAAPASPLAVVNAAPASVDPIFAAIESHKAAVAVLRAAVGVVAVRENELQAERATRGGKPERVEDAKLDECEAALSRAFDAETHAAYALLSRPPATMAGVIALLQYAIDADTDGEGWPVDVVDEDETVTRHWYYFLIGMLADVLPGLVPVAS